MLKRMRSAGPRDEGAPSVVGGAASEEDGSWINENPYAESKRPAAMNGMEYSNIRLLPIRSMRKRAVTVKIKLVTATTKEVRVGVLNPRSVNIVAE
jgi:hypothetical protein